MATKKFLFLVLCSLSLVSQTWAETGWDRTPRRKKGWAYNPDHFVGGSLECSFNYSPALYEANLNTIYGITLSPTLRLGDLSISAGVTMGRGEVYQTVDFFSRPINPVYSKIKINAYYLQLGIEFAPNQIVRNEIILAAGSLVAITGFGNDKILNVGYQATTQTRLAARARLAYCPVGALQNKIQLSLGVALNL
ncbi:MAG TPA: hypothetical protein VFV37_08060 [Luteibaculaceae bacterium]|nr:hypothetical protein [Luteibaculaceae bacterium]